MDDHSPGQMRQGHVLICMLGAHLTWHLRQARAPLTSTDEDLLVGLNRPRPFRGACVPNWPP
jgi:hypothetical protein